MNMEDYKRYIRNFVEAAEEKDSWILKQLCTLIKRYMEERRH